MTEDQTKLLSDLNSRMKKFEDLHDYFMKPPLPGQPTRAAQLDEILTARISLKFSLRMMLWIAGLIATVASAIAVFRTGGN